MFGGIDQLRAGRHRDAGRAIRAGLGTMLLLMLALGPVGAVPVSADPSSPLQVTKTANPNPVTSGGLLVYTISIKNTGGAKVDSVVMTDQINGVGTVQAPPGLPQLTITSTQGPCSQGGANGNVVTCQIGTIQGQGSVTITIGGQVTAAGPSTLQNTASVSGTKSAQNFTTNASVSVPVQPAANPLPDLTLNKTGPTSVPPTSNMTYTLTVNNLGSVNTANVKVVDTLPSGVTLQGTPYETTSLFNCTDNAPANPITVVCLGGTVNQGQNATIKINAKSPAATGQITNTAIVDPDNTIPESNELNNTSAAVNTNVTSAPPTPALTIFKTDNNPNVYPWSTGAGPDPVNPGQVLTYKIQVKNTATTRADDVVITDGTQALEAASITVSQVIVNGTVGVGGGCTVTGAQVRCLDRTLNAGGTITLTISGIVITGAGANIFNTATVTGNIKNQGVQASAQESTTVRPAVDLTITKGDAPDPVCARSWPTDPQRLAGGFTKFPPPLPNASGNIPAIGLLKPPVCLGGLVYHFVVGNSGQASASGVSIRDWLPAGVIFDSYQSSMPGLTCSVNTSNVITCNGGALGPASTETIDILVVAPASLGTITNSVTVDPNNAIFEPDETNNDATTTTNVTTGIDLVIFKNDKKGFDPDGGAPPNTEGFDPIATSGTGTYTIIVDNVGTQDATGIKVRDTLPAGTKFLSVTANQGFTCSHDGSATGGNVTCISGHLRGTESEFYLPNGNAGPAIGDEFATIKIRFFATPFVQQVGQTMHNEVRVDPDNEIAEFDELNNLATDDTVVTTGDDTIGAFNQLTIHKTQFDPSGTDPVATNGILIYNIHVTNEGTDPVSNVVVQDLLPTGSRFISATDATLGGPASAKFFCTHDGSAVGGVVTCTGGDFSGSINVIQPGPVPTDRDIRVKVFAPGTPQTAVDTATVDPANLVPEGNEFDNDDQFDTTVAPCVGLADCTAKNAVYELTIDKTKVSPSGDPVARNGIITYDLEVTNLGSDPVSGVTVTDRLPAGFGFLQARDTVPGSPQAFTCNGPDASGVVTCSGASLAGQIVPLGGAPVTRHIRIRVFAPDVPGEYVNHAFVDPNNTIPEGNEFNNQDSEVTNVANGGDGPFIDLNVLKTQEVLPGQEKVDDGTGTMIVQVTPGGPIKYVLEVKNLANNPDAGTAFNVTVRDVLPANVTFFSAADEAPGPGNFSCGQVPGQPTIIECTGGTIPANGSRKIDVFAVAPTHLDQIATDQDAIQQTLTNSAFVDPNNAILEGDETNNVAVLKTQVRSKINLKVEKDGPDDAQQNQPADYDIKVTNEIKWGTGAIAIDAHVFDYLPVGLIPLAVSTDKTDMTCQTFENPVNFIDCVGDIEPGTTVTIHVHTFVTAEGGPLDNEACVDPDHQIDETSELDNCKTKTTNVGATPPPTPTPEAKLIIDKSASTSVVSPGQAFSYSILVSNIGNATAANPVTVTDDLPDDSDSSVTFASATATNGFTCSEATGTVTCTDGGSGLPAGQATIITIQVTVDAGTTRPLFNEATVSWDSKTKTDSVTTNVGGADVDLVLADVDDQPDPVIAGAVVTYTIIGVNAGTSQADNLELAQTFLDTTGLTFLSATASQGFSCTFSDPAVTCTGDLPAGQSVIATVKFDTDGTAPSSLFSTVEIDSAHAFNEADEVNNTQFEFTTVQTTGCVSCYDLVAGPIQNSPNPVANNATLTWTFDVTNVGDIPTNDVSDAALDPVEIRINIDRGSNEYTNPTVSVPGFNCTLTSHAGDSGNTSPEILCTKDALAGGQGAVGTVTVTSNTAADPSVLFLDVEVDPSNKVAGEFDETNNTASNTASVDSP